MKLQIPLKTAVAKHQITKGVENKPLNEKTNVCTCACVVLLGPQY